MRMRKFGTRDDAVRNVSDTLYELVLSYRDRIISHTNNFYNPGIQRMLYNKIPEFTENILNSFKNV